MGADIVVGINVFPDSIQEDKSSYILKLDKVLKDNRVLAKRKISLETINNRIVELIEKNIKDDEIKRKLSEVFVEKRKTKEKIKSPNIFNILMQATFIMQREIAKVKMKEADISITTEFSRFVKPIEYYRAAECILEGEKAAEKVLPKLKRIISRKR